MLLSIVFFSSLLLTSIVFFFRWFQLRYITSHKNLITDDFVSLGSVVGPALGLQSTESVLNCKGSFFTTTAFYKESWTRLIVVSLHLYQVRM